MPGINFSKVNLNRGFNGFRSSVTLRKPHTDNFVNGTSAVYVDQQYDLWKNEPTSVHASWRAYFENVDIEANEPYQQPPSLGSSDSNAINDILAAFK